MGDGGGGAVSKPFKVEISPDYSLKTPVEYRVRFLIGDRTFVLDLSTPHRSEAELEAAWLDESLEYLSKSNTQNQK